MAISHRILILALITLVFVIPSLAQDNTYSKGIDVSACNGNIDWNQVSQQGIRFAYVRASIGHDLENYPNQLYNDCSNRQGWKGATDTKFVDNIEGAKSAYIWVGAYHAAKPDLGNDAADEAKWFVSVAKDYIKPGYLRPALDIEWDHSNVESKDSEYLKNWTDLWMSTVKDLTGVEPIIYTNNYYVRQCLAGETSLANYDVWMADTQSNTEPNLEGIWSIWSVWQHGTGSVQGIKSDVDLDYLNDNIGGLSYLAIPNPEGYAFGEWNFMCHRLRNL